MLISLISALCLNNALYILILAAVSFILLIIFKKELLFAILLGLLISSIIITTEVNPKYGPLADDIGKPFDCKLLVTEIDYSGENKKAVCEILNRSNHKVQAYFYGAELPQVNDIVSVKGLKLKSPADSSPEYAYYNNYLKSKGIRYTAFLSEKKYSITAHNQGTFPFKQARNINTFLNTKIQETFSNGRTSSFIQGLLLGNKDNFSDEDYDAFKNAGCLHIVSVSGYHVMLLLGILAVFLKKLPCQIRDIINILFLLSLILITGCSPSVIRAAVMVIITIISLYFRRDRDTLNALYLVAILYIISNRYIIHNASFVLSFTATFGIIMNSGYLSRLFSALPDILKNPIVATLSAQIGVFPASMLYFSTLSTYSIVPNIIISFTVPLIFILTPLALLTNFKPIILLCDFLCNFIFEAAHIVSFAPFSTINFQTGNLFLIIVTFFSFMLCILFHYLQTKALQKNLKE